MGTRMFGVIAVLVLAMGLVAPSAFAAPITWDGSTDSKGSEGTNWTGDTAPTDDTTTDTAVFDNGTLTDPDVDEVAGRLRLEGHRRPA